MHDISKLHPKETGIIASKPGFHWMHQVIGHVGICRHLDCWRMEALQWNAEHTTLELFAQSKPSFKLLQEMADCIMRKYVAGGRMQRLRAQPEAQRDAQYENSLLLNKYCLLYEEISHTMNTGDIRRVEACLVPWIFIFKATGKHKYAAHMLRFLRDVHFLYHAGLKWGIQLASGCHCNCWTLNGRHAVQYSILVNPTGKAGKFHVVDWCIELNNLYTKVSGSMHSKCAQIDIQCLGWVWWARIKPYCSAYHQRVTIGTGLPRYSNHYWGKLCTNTSNNITRRPRHDKNFQASVKTHYRTESS